MNTIILPIGFQPLKKMPNIFREKDSGFIILEQGNRLTLFGCVECDILTPEQSDLLETTKSYFPKKRKIFFSLEATTDSIQKSVNSFMETFNPYSKWPSKKKILPSLLDDFRDVHNGIL